MRKIHINPGRAWAYVGVGLGFSASITANVANTLLSHSTVSPWLRVPFAVIWPLLTYVAIEVLIRTTWQHFSARQGSTWGHLVVRLVLAGPVAFVAAFVSYLHQHHLMILAGEPGLAQAVGPLAVDGMLFGCTAALIITRAPSLPSPSLPSPQVTEEEMGEMKEIRRRWEEQEAQDLPIPVSPAVSLTEEKPAEIAPEKRTRAPRGEISPSLTAAVGMLLDGEREAVAAEKCGVGRSTLGRYAKAWRTLRHNPHAEIDCRTEKVRQELVDTMRSAARELMPR